MSADRAATVPTDVEVALRAFLAEFLGDRPLGPDDDLFEAGMNSLFVMQLINFTEGTFAVQMTDDDLETDNFRSLRAVSDLVRRKRDDGVR